MNGTSFTTQALSRLFFLFLLTAFATGLSAQVKLSVQGLVKKSDGTSLPDGNYDLSFRFYDTETGGAALATETVTTEINGGVYSAILGGGGGLDMLPFDKPYYVSVAVDGGTELLPRIALSAAPYAISLQGASNKFPSTGTVKADALEVAGGVSVVGAVSAASYGAVNATTVNATGNATLSGTTNTKTLFADGRIFSNSGFGYHNNGTDPGTGLFFDGAKKATIYTEGNVRFHAWDDNKNYYRATGGHVFDVGNVNLSNNLQVNGSINCNSFIRSGGTFTFTNDDDSGMYSPTDGFLHFRVNGTTVMELTTAYGENVNNENDWGATSLKVWGLQRGPDRRNVQYDPTNKRLFFDTSSRRYKRNIKPLDDDFSLILKAQPKTYTRPYDETNTWEVGYIAEEMDSLGLKRLVEYNADGTIDGFNYEKMILYVTEVVKMQHADIEQLKAEVAALTAEKNALRTENTSLRADAQNQQANFGKQLDELSRRLKSLETAASNR